MSPIVLDLNPFIQLTDEQFYQLCQNHRGIKFERNAQGELIVIPPVGGESGHREADLITDLNLWNRQSKLGLVFSSSTCFKLPNGADRSPDAAWVELGRWQALTPEQQRRFPPICPDFVMELRSAKDSLRTLQDKMQEYIDCGLRLGWLINPQNRQVEIYRDNQPKEVLENQSSEINWRNRFAWV